MTGLTDLTSAYADVRNRQRITGMTRAQADLFDFIKSYIKAHGYPPSYTEMAVGTGRSSKGNVRNLLDALVKRGHLVHTPGRARSIELAHKSCPHCGQPQ